VFGRGEYFLRCAEGRFLIDEGIPSNDHRHH
jgi:hypothetical protein